MTGVKDWLSQRDNGSAADNKRDSVQKKRHAHGATNGYSKLNEHTVRQVRRLFAEGKTQQEIADFFGVHQTTVSKLICRRLWRHID